MVRVRARHIGERDGECAAGDRATRDAEIGRIAGEASDEHGACASVRGIESTDRGDMTTRVEM